MLQSAKKQLSHRLKSGFLLAALCAGSFAGVLPVVAQEEEPYKDRIPEQKETSVVHSRSAETPAMVAYPVGPDGAPASSLTLKSGVSYTVPKGTPMALKIVSVPTNGMRLLQKDLEGNPMPAHVNDVISAQITEDIYVDGDRVIPEGTIFRGHVVHINRPRRVQRPGVVEITFNELELPNHRIFKFRAEADNLEKSTMKTKAHAAGMVAANAAGGAIVGAMAAYYLFGMHNTIACHGYNIAGGAAGGAVLAATHAVMKRGHVGWLEPGDGLNLSIDTDMVMPALQAPTKHVPLAATNTPGINIDVLKGKVVKSGIGGSLYRLDVDIQNESDKTLLAIDLFLRDTTGFKCPLVGGPEFDNDSTFTFRLEPGDNLRSRIYFDVEHPKLPHEFVWYDHYNRKKITYRQKLEL